MDIVVKLEKEPVSEFMDAQLVHSDEQIDIEESDVKQERLDIKIEWEAEDSVADNVKNEDSAPPPNGLVKEYRILKEGIPINGYFDDSSLRDPVRVEHVCHACSYKASQNKLLRIHQLFSCCELEHTSECGSVPGTSKSHHHRHTTSESGPSTSTDQQNINTHDDSEQGIVKTDKRRKISIAQNLIVYSCNECSYKSVLKSHLKNHTKVHTGLTLFMCDQCDYKTKRSDHFKSHKITHTGHRPFACDLCDYKAANLSNLKRHIQTHSGHKRFACDKCNYKAVRFYGLRIHKLKHTG